MLKNNIVEASESPWASPMVLAKKKDGTWRFCVDYRRLNAITKKDAYPLPRIDDVVDALGFGEGCVYSTLDIASGDWHIPIHDEDVEKTAFTTQSGTWGKKLKILNKLIAPREEDLLGGIQGRIPSPLVRKRGSRLRSQFSKSW